MFVHVLDVGDSDDRVPVLIINSYPAKEQSCGLYGVWEAELTRLAVATRNDAWCSSPGALSSSLQPCHGADSFPALYAPCSSISPFLSYRIFLVATEEKNEQEGYIASFSFHSGTKN